MDVTETVRAFVENQCKKPTSKYGYAPYKFHFVSMVKYANKLVDVMGGDREVVNIAAWLHDIGSIMYGRENHHITGSDVAGRFLLELGYSQEKTELVKKCILNSPWFKKQSTQFNRRTDYRRG